MDKKLEPREAFVIKCDRQLNVTRFSPCGKFLFGGGYDATIRRWDITGEEPRDLARIEGHHGWVQWPRSR
ncbi:MAG: hypothetical protein QGG36_18145 [Pirellulaceae bacterium]|jgi:WD40 repeat protein|nr:hypothetical protein [Pirellulaceae bacterium]